MIIINKIKEYKHRNLSIGRVKNLDKRNPNVFCIEKISWDVHWQTDLYLAVIIRDYLRFFIINSPAVGNCVYENRIEDMYDLEKSDYYSKKWKKMVNNVADEFDELVKLMNRSNSGEIKDYLKFENKMKNLEKRAFADLADIFGDLNW